MIKSPYPVIPAGTIGIAVHSDHSCYWIRTDGTINYGSFRKCPVGTVDTHQVGTYVRETLKIKNFDIRKNNRNTVLVYFSCVVEVVHQELRIRGFHKATKRTFRWIAFVNDPDYPNEYRLITEDAFLDMVEGAPISEREQIAHLALNPDAESPQSAITEWLLRQGIEVIEVAFDPNAVNPVYHITVRNPFYVTEEET